MSSRPCVIAILGGGPAGSTLAALLAQAGLHPVLFDDEKTPDLIVGESLIPAIIPFLRRLGIEDEVAAISKYKPGVSFIHPQADHDIDFTFESVRDVLPTYAYNVPRPAFDRILANRAGELGVTKIRHRATVQRDGESGRLCLTKESMAAAPVLQGRQPDWLVDATGRHRLFARTLGIEARVGPRKDVAYFAHYEGCQHSKATGQVIITRLESGWSWRIPLRNRMSIGVVINREVAKDLGDCPESRLAAAITRDSYLAEATRGAQRISPVKTYSNYQLVSQQGHGPGWVQLGDAYGFVDPMLSPGLFLAMESANLLADAFIQADDPSRGPSETTLARYATQFEHWLQAWSELVEMFYDGRLFSLQEAGHRILEERSNRLTRGIQKHLQKHIACMAAGAWTTRGYSRRLVRLSTKHLVWGVTAPEDLAIA